MGGVGWVWEKKVKDFEEAAQSCQLPAKKLTPTSIICTNLSSIQHMKWGSQRQVIHNPGNREKQIWYSHTLHCHHSFVFDTQTSTWKCIFLEHLHVNIVLLCNPLHNHCGFIACESLSWTQNCAAFIFIHVHLGEEGSKLSKLTLHSSFCAVTTDSKPRWPHYIVFLQSHPGGGGWGVTPQPPSPTDAAIMTGANIKRRAVQTSYGVFTILSPRKTSPEN